MFDRQQFDDRVRIMSLHICAQVSWAREHGVRAPSPELLEFRDYMTLLNRQPGHPVMTIGRTLERGARASIGVV